MNLIKSIHPYPSPGHMGMQTAWWKAEKSQDPVSSWQMLFLWQKIIVLRQNTMYKLQHILGNHNIFSIFEKLWCRQHLWGSLKDNFNWSFREDEIHWDGWMDRNRSSGLTAGRHMKKTGCLDGSLDMMCVQIRNNDQRRNEVWKGKNWKKAGFQLKFWSVGKQDTQNS